MYVIQPKPETGVETDDSLIAEEGTSAASFLNAFREMKAGTKPWRSYIRYMLTRAVEEDTTFNDSAGSKLELRDTDPFGFGVYCWTTRNTVKDTAPLEELFNTYNTRPISEVRGKLERLDDELEKCMRGSLAYLAVKERRPDLLEMYFERGFRYEGYFEDEANCVKREEDPETFRVLEESDFRKAYPRKGLGATHDTNSEDEDSSDSGYDDPDLDELERDKAAGNFDEGGRFPVEW